MSKIPHGYCHCGCGGITRKIRDNDSTRGDIKGQPRKYIKGHQNRDNALKRKLAPDYNVDENGCWIWVKGLDAMGYGRYRRVSGNQPDKKAHRVIYELHKGPVPKGLFLDHLCRNRACVNPDHLEPVTAAENNRRGLKTKLSKDQVLEVRRLALLNVPQEEIAKEYGVCRQNVSMIKLKRSWADI